MLSHFSDKGICYFALIGHPFSLLLSDSIRYVLYYLVLFYFLDSPWYTGVINLNFLSSLIN
jgi:hypothetical protein